MIKQNLRSKDNMEERQIFKSSSDSDFTSKMTLTKPGGELVDISSILKV